MIPVQLFESLTFFSLSSENTSAFSRRGYRNEPQGKLGWVFEHGRQLIFAPEELWRETYSNYILSQNTILSSRRCPGLKTESMSPSHIEFLGSIEQLTLQRGVVLLGSIGMQATWVQCAAQLCIL